MVTIKCQRLREDRTFEEIEIEVPAGVYNNIQTVGSQRYIKSCLTLNLIPAWRLVPMFSEQQGEKELWQSTEKSHPQEQLTPTSSPLSSSKKEKAWKSLRGLRKS